MNTSLNACLNSVMDGDSSSGYNLLTASGSECDKLVA